MARLAGLLSRIGGAMLRGLLEIVMAVVPPRRHAVVYGVPDTEGNAVEVVRRLIEQNRRRIVWLTESRDPRSVEWAVEDCPARRRPRVVPKRSARGLLWYVSAQTVFYTHRLFLSPRPRRARTFVNLWHGDGPKLTSSLRPTAPSDSVVVAGTWLWGRNKARALGMDERRLLVVGNPRIDQFLRPAGDAALSRLGLDPHRPFLVWAPTFREAAHGRRRLSDTERLSRTGAAASLRELTAALDPSDLPQILVKPHPLDSDDYAGYGLLSVDDAQLRDLRLAFYQLLARCGGLVTDYSSIWVDYLALDRPIGFYCPDLDEYAAARELDRAQFLETLGGPLLRDPGAMLGFCQAVARGEDPQGERRATSVAELGAVVELGATSRLMARLAEGP